MYVRHHGVRVDGGYLRPQCRAERGGIALGADDQECIPPVATEIRQIELRARRRIQPGMAHIGYNADDSHPMRRLRWSSSVDHSHTTAKRISPGPIQTCSRLADNHNRLRLVRIRFSETATAQESHPHRPEVVRRHGPRVAAQRTVVRVFVYGQDVSTRFENRG